MSYTFNNLFSFVSNASTPGFKAQGLSGVADLSSAAAQFFNRKTVQWNIEDDLEYLSEEIESLMPPEPLGGVLICVGIAEWKHSDPNMIKQHKYLGLHIAGAGKSPDEAMKKYRKIGSIVNGVPVGWVRLDRFVWITKLGKSNLSLNSISDGY